MAETETQQSGTTAAKQMLAALTRASQEMTRKFSDSCEQASRLNATLENKVNERLAEINDQADLIVRNQLESLSAEKDSILAELTELRREELKVVQTLGKKLRNALGDKLKELSAELDKEMTQSLSSFQEQLTETERSITQNLDSKSESLSKEIPELMQKLKSERQKELEQLAEAHSKHLDEYKSKTAEGLAKLADHVATLKSSLNEEGSGYVNTLDSVIEKLVCEQQNNLKEKIDALAEVNERVSQSVQSDREHFEKLPEQFADSCKQVAELKLKLHGSRVNNLALIYRTEIMSLAKQSEDQAAIIRARLQSVLHNHLDSFNEQSAKLLQKFEKNAREAMPVAETEKTKTYENDGLPEAVAEFIDKLKQDLKITAKESASAAKSVMEDSLDDFRSKINSSSQNYAHVIEKSFNEARKEISEMTDANKEKLEELTQKSEALEQLVGDARDLLSALD